ncbi:MAG: PQQ-dependent sugar dehydrogenase [Phycisphaeraceae bacterium]
MRTTALLLAFALALSSPLAAQTPSPRTPWTTSRIVGTPEPPLPFIAQRVAPHLTFNQPVEIVGCPPQLGRRMAVVERGGKVFTYSLDADRGDAILMIDLKQQYDKEVRECYSIAFEHDGVGHRFDDHRYAYLFIILDGKGKPNRDNGTRIVRFNVVGGSETGKSLPRLNPASAKTILTFISGGHNGGSLRFGPDGMLYIGIGDAEVPEPPDPRDTGQDLSDLLSSILRIDVSENDEGKPYRIPADNPFVKLQGARGEIWAYGLRNPWRMSFFNDELLVGDVGWELWEGIYRVQRGRNFGWSITEASKQVVKPQNKIGPTPITPPLVVHSHEECMSITGGEVYRGKLRELSGDYIYGDYETGRLWALRHDGDKLTSHREIADTTLKLIGFGIDAQGELLFADMAGGGIYRLATNPESKQPSTFPRKLSESGLFEDVTKQKLAAGVYEYNVLAERWADHAKGARLIALPGSETLGIIKPADGALPSNRWNFPANTVLAKTYSLQLTRGRPDTAKPIETQLLHYSGQTWFAYTYRWNEAGTDAELVGPSGDERAIEVIDAAAPGGKLKQNWRFYSRAECQRCHTAWINFVPGFSKLQLDYRKSEEEAKRWEMITGLTLERDEPKLVDPHDASQPLDLRARSWLHANCGLCHRQNGGGSVPSFLNIEAKLEAARLLDAMPTQGTFDLPDGRVIAAGDPFRSVLLLRIMTTGRGHMPYVGSRMVDDRGAILIRDWINGMPASGTNDDAQARRKQEDETLARLIKGDAKALDALLQSTSGSSSLAMAITDGSLRGEVRQTAIDRSSALRDPLRRDLFQRFLPDERRRTVLGDRIDPLPILALKGNAASGKTLFFQQGGGQCATCHRIGNEGTAFGPDLSRIGEKFKPDELLAQLLDPSLRIEEAWQAVLIETDDGSAHTGFVTARTNEAVTLRIADGKDVSLPVKSILSQRTQQLSIMPQGLLSSMTAQEAADLLAYLASLK